MRHVNRCIYGCILIASLFGNYSSDAGTPVESTDTTVVSNISRDDGYSNQVNSCRLYKGIIPKQDSLARACMNCINSFDFPEARRLIKKIRRIERKYHLLPFSSLIETSCLFTRISRSDYSDAKGRLELIEEIENIKDNTHKLIRFSDMPDTLLPLALFISGGTRGLYATVKIESNMVAAAIEGFEAFRQLEKALLLFPDMHDACMGIGIFYCVLAKAPLMVRAALNISGLDISFDHGLNYLRTSVHNGRYTSVAASLYLIQFLSPYWGHLVQEKDSLFKMLETVYPGNPYYTFLKIDEEICFHPERITSSFTDSLALTIEPRMKNDNNCTRRYRELIKWQYLFIRDSMTVDLHTDTLFTLGEYSFYPYFLYALLDKRKSKRVLSPDGSSLLTSRESMVLRLLGLSEMSSSEKKYFEWRIRDVLEVK